MYVYILIFAIIGIIYFYYLPRGGMPKKVFAWIMLALGLFVGLSDMLGGYDRYIYGELFDRMSDNIESGRAIEMTYIYQFYSKELGYVYLNYIISFFTSNRYIFILVITLIMYYLFYKAFIKETDNYGFALLLFLGLYFFFTFTYLRQALAVAIVGFSYRYIVDRKLIKYCILMMTAVMFHNSAIIFFPMYFLVKRIPSKSVIIIGAIVCLGIGLTGIPANLFEIYGDVSESASRAMGYMEDDSGFRIEYVLEAVVFLYFLIAGYNRVPKNRRGYMHYNIALVFCAVLLIFCRSLQGGRLGWSFIIGLIFAITPSVKSTWLNKGGSIILPIMAFLLYLRILTSWGTMLSPYKTFLTPGVRMGDMIHLKYEYDSRYDEDKFYR